MTLDLASDLLTAVVALRVFGSDARTLLRRVAAVGVRVGAAELNTAARRRGGTE